MGILVLVLVVVVVVVGYLQAKKRREDRIAASRRFYNGNVRAHNTRVHTFPSNLVAAAFRFGPREFFELREAVTPPVGG